MIFLERIENRELNSDDWTHTGGLFSQNGNFRLLTSGLGKCSQHKIHHFTVKLVKIVFARSDQKSVSGLLFS